MIIAIPSQCSRNVNLFANSYHKEYGATIISYVPENIYDTLLIDRPQLIITDSVDYDIYKSIFNDIDNKHISNYSKFIVLGDESLKRSYIRYIRRDTYITYNEYIQPNLSEKFILCVMDCSDIENNNRLKDILYPNILEMPVRLVNCPQFESINNLGIADEDTILDLITKCEIFINLNNIYLYDAIHLNKKIINLAENNTIQLNINTIKSANTINFDINKYKISNLVKYIKI
jgi:hypothetical protein